MPENQVHLLTDCVQEINSKKRLLLLPWWIKIFTWLFLILAAFVPVIIILGIIGYSVDIALYGFETNQPLSVSGLGLIFLFLIKFVTSFGLLKKKDWAIRLAIIDSVIGIALCIFFMTYSILSANMKFAFRIELLLLIPYLLKMRKIRSEWENYMVI